MSFILIDNGNLASPVLIPGATSRNNQDGSCDGTATFAVQKGAASHTSPGTQHPKDSNLFCSDSEIEWLEAYCLIKNWYKGVWNGTIQKIDGISSAAQDKIELNKNFITSLAGSWNAPLNNAVFLPIDSTLPLSASNNYFAGWPANQLSTDGIHYLGGVNVFYNAGLTIRISYTSASTSAVTSLISGGGAIVGTVLDSLVAGHITFSPSYTGGFLCTGVNYNETALGGSAQVEQITEEWLFSPAPGWNTDIYS